VKNLVGLTVKGQRQTVNGILIRREYSSKTGMVPDTGRQTRNIRITFYS
jgi:hypothetical protein